jgi:hypothetical protein
MQERTALFWVVTQRVVVISSRRLGAGDGTDRLSRNVGKVTTTRWVTTQKSTVVSYFAAKPEIPQNAMFFSATINNTSDTNFTITNVTGSQQVSVTNHDVP